MNWEISIIYSSNFLGVFLAVVMTSDVYQVIRPWHDQTVAIAYSKCYREIQIDML